MIVEAICDIPYGNSIIRKWNRLIASYSISIELAFSRSQVCKSVERSASWTTEALSWSSRSSLKYNQKIWMANNVDSSCSMLIIARKGAAL